MKCDEGYPCQICGGDVEHIAESDLYLRYVIGMVDPEVLHTSAERHIRCNPGLAQFIVSDDFEPLVAEGPFDKRHLDQAFVSAREQLVTRGWQRLQQIHATREGLSVLDYPLEDVRERMRQQFGDRS
jgi:hypothetical protein